LRVRWAAAAAASAATNERASKRPSDPATAVWAEARGRAETDHGVGEGVLRSKWCPNKGSGARPSAMPEPAEPWAPGGGPQGETHTSLTDGAGGRAGYSERPALELGVTGGPRPVPVPDDVSVARLPAWETEQTHACK